MKVKELLEQASRCKTDTDVEQLLDRLQQTFAKSRWLRHLSVINREACIENHPFVRFEFNREISEDYVMMIQPQIRDGECSVTIQTNRILDRLGLSSQHWEVIDGMDELIECDPERTVSDVAVRAAELAMMQHSLLIESVGVPETIARKTAKVCWSG
jgi:hypothetical protein